MQRHVYAHAFTCVHVNTRMHAHTHTHMHMHTHTHTHTLIHTYLHTNSSTRGTCSEEDHTVVDFVVPPAGAPNGEKVAFAGYEGEPVEVLAGAGASRELVFDP